MDGIDEFEIEEFKPCVIETPEIGLTEMILEDCFVVWKPFGPKGHFLDLGYDLDGNLVGIKVWANVAKIAPHHQQKSQSVERQCK